MWVLYLAQCGLYGRRPIGWCGSDLAHLAERLQVCRAIVVPWFEFAACSFLVQFHAQFEANMASTTSLNPTSLVARHSMCREVTRTNVFGALSEDDGRVTGAEIVISTFLLDDGELSEQSEDW